MVLQDMNWKHENFGQLIQDHNGKPPSDDEYTQVETGVRVFLFHMQSG